MNSYWSLYTQPIRSSDAPMIGGGTPHATVSALLKELRQTGYWSARDMQRQGAKLALITPTEDGFNVRIFQTIAAAKQQDTDRSKLVRRAIRTTLQAS